MLRTLGLASLFAALTVVEPAFGLVIDPNFEETPYASFADDASVTSMAFAPDGSGRLFVTRKQGEIFVVDDGVTLPQPFAVVSPVWSANECGLLGIAFDPDFSNNSYVYVFVTVSTTEQRILRYRALGNVAEDETVLVAGLPTRGENHVGGALAFGPDAKLYFAIGDLAYDVGHGDDLTSVASKLGRVNRDGSAPSDNPFADGPGPNHELVYARGLRNPFSMTFQPTTGRAWVNVVGTDHEQVLVLGAGDHGGYPTYEANQPAGYVAPVFSYPTNLSEIGGCITGGTFFDSSGASAEYRDDFFFGDFNTGRITRADVSGSTVQAVHAFGEHRRAVDMTMGPDGDLYYVSHSGEGQVSRARFRATAQGLVVTPLHAFLVEGGAAVLNVRLAEAPATSLTVTVTRTSGDEDVRVIAGASLTFDATDWATPKVVRIAAERDADVSDDVTLLELSATGVPSESVSVRVHDEWTGDLPAEDGGQGGEGGAEAGLGGERAGGFGGAASGAAGRGGRAGDGAGPGGSSAGAPELGGDGGDAGEGVMGNAGRRAGGGHAGAGARGSTAGGGCGCSTTTKPPGASLVAGVLLVLFAMRRRLRARA